MHNVIQMLLARFLGTLLLAFSFTPLQGEMLTLSCEIDGKPAPLVAVANDSLLVGTIDKKAPAPDDVKWSLSGNIADNAGYVRWAPRYSFTAIPPSEFNQNGPSFSANVGIDSNHGQTLERLKLVDWPSTPAAGSAIVAIWLVNGKPIKIKIRPVSFVAIDYTGDRFNFELSPAEARGQPILLLWSNGTFVRPLPEYSHESTQRAFVAVMNNSLFELKTAIAGGAQLTKKSRTGATLAHYAAMVDAVDVLAFLVQQNPGLARAKTDFGDDTPLHWAVMTGKAGAVKVLLAANSSKKELTQENFVREGRMYSGVTFGTLISGPLQSAIRLGHTEVVQLLLDAGASPNEGKREAPIATAISYGYSEIAEILLHAGATHNFKSKFSQSSLANQAGFGREPLVRFLLEHQVNPDSVTYETISSRNGATALMKAAEANAVQTAAVLIEHGANQDRQGPEGNTALHIAASNDFPGIAKLLLDRHADISLRNNAGLRPLDEALLNEAKETALILYRAGAHIDIHSSKIDALLESALRQDLSEIISSAIVDGWNPNAKIQTFCPALTLAKYYGATSCESLLHASAAAESTGQILPIANINELDAKLNPVKMEMPKNQRIHSKSAIVRVEFIVNGEGKPMFAHVLNSPPRQLAVTTLNAVKGWTFTKPTVSGKPVWVKVTVPVVFKRSD